MGKSKIIARTPYASLHYNVTWKKVVQFSQPRKEKNLNRVQAMEHSHFSQLSTAAEVYCRIKAHLHARLQELPRGKKWLGSDSSTCHIVCPKPRLEVCTQIHLTKSNEQGLQQQLYLDLTKKRNKVHNKLA